MEWVAIFALAFLIRGASRVYDDFAAQIMDQPGYVQSMSPTHIMLAMATWWQRQNPTRLALNFLYTSLFVWLAFWLLGFVVQSVGARFAILLLAPAIILWGAFRQRSLRQRLW